MASEARVDVPPPAELAAANYSTAGQPWLGCILADAALMGGEVVGLLEGAASADACCRACRQRAGCNTWNHCGLPGGCRCVGPAGWQGCRAGQQRAAARAARAARLPAGLSLPAGRALRLTVYARLSPLAWRLQPRRAGHAVYRGGQRKPQAGAV